MVVDNRSLTLAISYKSKGFHMHTKPTVLVLQFLRQGYTGTGTWKTQKTDFPTTKRNKRQHFLRFRAAPYKYYQLMPIQRQYTPADSRRYITHLDSVHEGTRHDKKIHAKSTVQVSWYPRVQFKVRVFRPPVVTGTVPVVLYILVRLWKGVISMVRAASASAKHA